MNSNNNKQRIAESISSNDVSVGSVIPLFEQAVNFSICAKTAANEMYLKADGIPSKIWIFYVKAKSLLCNKFGEEESMDAINDFAIVDNKHENKTIKNAAKRFVDRYKLWANIPVFVDNMKRDGIAGFTTGDLLYVMHECVKPESKKYQCTVFGKGLGPLSDTQHDSIDRFIKEGIFHVGIPSYAEVLGCAELFEVELQYQEKINVPIDAALAPKFR
jgi:hypothetical protein